MFDQDGNFSIANLERRNADKIRFRVLLDEAVAQEERSQHHLALTLASVAFQYGSNSYERGACGDLMDRQVSALREGL